MYTTGLIDSCFKFQITMQWAKDFELQYVLIVSPCRNAPQAKILGIWTLSNEFTYGFDPFRSSFLPFASSFLLLSLFLFPFAFLLHFSPKPNFPNPNQKFPQFPQNFPKIPSERRKQKKKLYPLQIRLRGVMRCCIAGSSTMRFVEIKES